MPLISSIVQQFKKTTSDHNNSSAARSRTTIREDKRSNDNSNWSTCADPNRIPGSYQSAPTGAQSRLTTRLRFQSHVRTENARFTSGKFPRRQMLGCMGQRLGNDWGYEAHGQSDRPDHTAWIATKKGKLNLNLSSPSTARSQQRRGRKTTRRGRLSRDCGPRQTRSPKGGAPPSLLPHPQFSHGPRRNPWSSNPCTLIILLRAYGPWLCVDVACNLFQCVFS